MSFKSEDFKMMTDKEWEILQQFDACRKETKAYVTGFEMFWITFFVTIYAICLMTAVLGE